MKKNNLYRQDNEFFLQAKSMEEGIISTPSGVLYRKLKEGKGKEFATPNSIVFVNYTGTLIDGTIFDTTQGQPLPACLVVKNLIMGWQIALTRMKEGDQFEVFIPHEYGYGKRRMGKIPPYSTLIFTIELVKMERR